MNKDEINRLAENPDELIRAIAAGKHGQPGSERRDQAESALRLSLLLSQRQDSSSMQRWTRHAAYAAYIAATAATILMINEIFIK